MYGVVPAAGKGTRLRPLTDDTPKGMVDIGGRPLLSHVFDRLLAVGIDHLVVVVGYELGAITEHYDDSYRGTPITYVHQRQQLGLGHAIAQCASVVSGTFVVCNGDNVFAEPQQRAVDRAHEAAVDAVVVTETVSRQEATQTGVVETDGSQVRRIVEKPDEPRSRLSTTGWYVLPEAIVSALDLVRPSDRGEYELADGLSVLAAAGRRIETVELDGRRINVNTPDDIGRAEQLLD